MKAILDDIRSGALPPAAVLLFFWFLLTDQEIFGKRRSNPVYLVEE